MLKEQTNPSKIAAKTLALLKRSEATYKEKNMPIPKIHYVTENTFAPIYDSGSSLGRELRDNVVESYLQSEKDLKQYVTRGQAEIHWENKKVTHFELIHTLLTSPHQESIRKIIGRVVEKFDGTKIETILNQIDQNVPESHAGYRIPESRKQLIFKIISLRFEMLKTLINE